MHKVGPDFWPGSILSSQTILPRCPTECRLSSSEGIWHAQVSIRLVVDQQGNPLQRPTLQRFGDIITSKTRVEERIKRAQLAILNPSTPAKDFLTADLPFSGTNESRFSKNSICLDISGPGVDDLAFVDLPGTCQVSHFTLVFDVFQVSLFLGAPTEMIEISKMSRPSSAVILKKRTASFS